MERAFRHPQVEAVEGGECKTLGVPVKFSETSGEVRGPPSSRVGEHCVQALREAGFTAEEIEGRRGMRRSVRRAGGGGGRVAGVCELAR